MKRAEDGVGQVLTIWLWNEVFVAHVLESDGLVTLARVHKTDVFREAVPLEKLVVVVVTEFVLESN